MNNCSLDKDNYYLSLAFLISMKSKDPSTRVGAVCVMDDQTIYTGYNGCSPGFLDSLLGVKPTKYDVVIHAEINSLNRAGLERCRAQKNAQLYITFAPCPRCAIQILNHGIKRVIYASDYKSQTNDSGLLETIRRNGVDNGESAFELIKYSGEPLLFSHKHMGIK